MNPRLPLLCALLLILSGGLFAQEPTPSSGDSVYRHAATQFVWPAQAGAFRRDPKPPIQYDEKGLDMSVGYRHPSGIFATVYVYPVVGRDLKAHFAECCQAIERYPGARLVQASGPIRNPRPVQITVAGKPHSGWYAQYLLPNGMTGKEGGMGSEIYLFPMGKEWFFLFRISWPSAAGDQAEKLIPPFIRAFAWPELPAGP